MLCMLIAVCGAMVFLAVLLALKCHKPSNNHICTNGAVWISDGRRELLVLPDMIEKVSNRERLKGHMTHEVPTSSPTEPSPARVPTWSEYYKDSPELRYPYMKTDPAVAFDLSISSAPRYSIIMPVYNQEKIIKLVIRSIFNHTTGPYEYIIVNDGSEDGTLKMILEICGELKNVLPKSCVRLLVVHITESVFETAADNFGFKLARAPILIEVQADMIMSKHSYNTIVSLPIVMFDDVIAVSGRACHSHDESVYIGVSRESIKSSGVGKFESDPENSRFRFYICDTCNRGPWALHAKKLQELGYLNERQFFLANDDHDLCKRAAQKHGWRAGFVPGIHYESNLADGSTRKQRTPSQKMIHKTRKERTNFHLGTGYNWDRVLNTATYRLLTSPIHHVSFGNTGTVHYANVELAAIKHEEIGLRFDTSRIYTERDVEKTLLETMPLDVLRGPKRGYYFWAWKPLVVKLALSKVSEGDLLVYSDAGMFIFDYALFSDFTQRTETGSFTTVEHDSFSYTKCNVTNELSDASTKLRMVDASFFVLRNIQSSRDLIDDWISLSRRSFFISDTPSGECVNHISFIDHRHDQSLLNVAVRQRPDFKVFDRELRDRFLNHHRYRSLEYVRELIGRCMYKLKTPCVTNVKRGPKVI